MTDKWDVSLVIVSSQPDGTFEQRVLDDFCGQVSRVRSMFVDPKVAYLQSTTQVQGTWEKFPKPMTGIAITMTAVIEGVRK